ncbi:hypothetical protein [Oceanobacter kriegii]|uniref:hypothetical protein n=1 Tax=Oceanobacter kriegii TaxID=64972 RepID=UPI0012EB37F5|nr:hypothetical protein [Oceanobacter kriegii]
MSTRLSQLLSYFSHNAFGLKRCAPLVMPVLLLASVFCGSDVLAQQALAQSASNGKALDQIASITVNGEVYLKQDQLLQWLKHQGVAVSPPVTPPASQSAAPQASAPKSNPPSREYQGTAKIRHAVVTGPAWNCSLKPPFADNFFEATAATRHQATNWVSGECMKALQDAVQCRESRVVCSED